MSPEIADSPLRLQARRIDSYALQVAIREQGTVVSIGDGIAWIKGLPSAAIDDILICADGSRAQVFDLTPAMVGAVLLEDSQDITSGTAVHLAHRRLSIPVGDALLGRVVDPLGHPQDGLPPPRCPSTGLLEQRAPAIIERDIVHEPLYSGSKIIDSMIPIGKGQRQLIIGDRGLGRSALAIDAVLSQRGRKVRCVYVLIGQRRSIVARTIAMLREQAAMEYSCVVVAEATALPGQQFIAPFAGCAIAEHWMRQGHDTLVVYDDLSTHAQTYRELSLLLRRPPGREAFPGDIFSVHARLLERSTRLADSLGGGSMSALPVVETQEGEIAAYIPTNLISITDGQIYLDAELFAAGFRPAIDIGRSVSRIGGAAQHPAIKREAGRIKLDYLQFLELEVFTRFGARLEASMEHKIHRGRVLRACLLQDRLTPLSPEFQMAWLVAFNDGHLDKRTPEEAGKTLEHLELQMRESPLDLDSPRSEWAALIRDFLQG